MHRQNNQIQILTDPTALSPLLIQLHLQFTLQPPQLILIAPIHSPQLLQQTLRTQIQLPPLHFPDINALPRGPKSLSLLIGNQQQEVLV